ncbi:MAG: malate dehydrogenase, partial [Archaeoglobaceae archaeon]
MSEKMIEKAELPSKLAPSWHRYYAGKIETLPKCAIRGMEDFAIWYSPGVAAPCKEIAANQDKVYEYTNKWNTIA